MFPLATASAALLTSLERGKRPVSIGEQKGQDNKGNGCLAAALNISRKTRSVLCPTAGATFHVPFIIFPPPFLPSSLLSSSPDLIFRPSPVQIIGHGVCRTDSHDANRELSRSSVFALEEAGDDLAV